MFLFLKQLALALFLLATNTGDTDMTYRNTSQSLHAIRNNTDVIVAPDKDQVNHPELAVCVPQL